MLVYFGVSAAMLAALLWTGSRFRASSDPSLFFSISLVMGIFLMLYLPKLLFNATQLLGDIPVLAARIIRGAGETGATLEPAGSGALLAGAISFRKWCLVPGATLGIGLFIAFGMGMLRGRTNVKVFREKVAIAGLPDAFDGLRIVQLSDLHLAGFYNQPAHVSGIVEKVNSLEPDMILFTGDMVHNFAEELDPFIEILNVLQAPLGKFAVLGNHDYGRYFSWESAEEEEANLEGVKEQVRNAGFDLLLNEHRTVSRNGGSLEIVGVENWGKPPFPREGDLQKALAGTDPGLVKILLSHDPSHWDLQVRGKAPVALTLSGHTHGMQFGFEIGDFRWSPSRWTYEHWAGLYGENGQYLYVNRGLGYTGFPGRVGIRPEITLLELRRAPVPSTPR